MILSVLLEMNSRCFDSYRYILRKQENLMDRDIPKHIAVLTLRNTHDALLHTSATRGSNVESQLLTVLIPAAE